MMTTNTEKKRIEIEVWYFGAALAQLSNLVLAVKTQQAWNANEGEMLRMGRAELKRRGLVVP